MTTTFRLTVAQMNPVAGDLVGNARLAREAWQAGREAGAGMVALSEMFITGYPIQDLAIRPAFVADAMAAVEALARDCAEGPALGIGAPHYEDGRLYNAYCICQNGHITARVLKHVLPNAALFDEVRIYASGPISGPYSVGLVRIGTPIGEDAWHEDVSEALAESGAEILLVPNSSPYYRGKFGIRVSHMVARTVETRLPLVYLNMVGGQDDQVFDGATFVLNPGGRLAHQLPMLETEIRHVDFDETAEGWRARDGDKARLPDEWEGDYRVMVASVRDFCGKSGFSKVVLGLSGGVDSALVATIAADALGPENVRCVMLPSEHTGAASLEDAASVARALGCRLDEVSIEGPRRAMTEALAPLLQGREADPTEENIQSRLRGVMLMALGNRFGEMLLTTGNKSELAVGYDTLHGDMAGGYNPVKDLYKTRLVATCRWRNANHCPWMKGPEGEVIAPRIIDKPSSAESLANQKDGDSLPPHAEIDIILEELIDRDGSVADVVAMGHERVVVEKIEGLIYGSEHKRHQSAPGPRLTSRAFWRDRRYPIVNRWRDRS